DSVHHIWCPLSSQEYQDLPDGAETTLTSVLLFPGMFRSGTVSAGNAPEKNVSLYNLEAHVFQGSPQNSEKIVR
ncbi:hypothetical protein, partial [Klebsiella pneumoniae]